MCVCFFPQALRREDIVWQISFSFEHLKPLSLISKVPTCMLHVCYMYVTDVQYVSLSSRQSDHRCHGLV